MAVYTGTPGDDVRSETGGDDDMSGLGGDDTLSGLGGVDILFGGEEGGSGEDGDDILRGGDNDDLLIGGTGSDTLEGGAGNDVLISGGVTGSVSRPMFPLPFFIFTPAESGNGAAIDVLDGGAGSDHANLLYGEVSGDIVLDLSDSQAFNQIFVDGVARGSVTGCERLTFFGGAGDDVVTGATGAASGQNALLGGGGDDVLTGGIRSDFLSGEAGNDHLISNGTFGSTLSGGTGDDHLEGGAGGERFLSGAGDDLIEAGDGVDTLSYGDQTGGVTVDLTLATAQGVKVDGVDTLTGIENVEGSAFTDLIRGDDAGNVLNGGRLGSDRLFGGGGDDDLDAVRFNISSADFAGGESFELDGGDGADSLRAWGDTYFDDFFDTAILNGGAGDDVIEARDLLSAEISAGEGDDQITIEVEKTDYDITLGAGVDTLLLGGGADVLESRVTVSDFLAGDDGDVLNMNEFLDFGPLENFDIDEPGADPFASGHLRLFQVGADTALRVDLDGGGDAFVDFFTFRNMRALDFTSVNFAGYAPVVAASMPTEGDDVLVGTPDDDVIDGLGGNDQISGLGGDDELIGGGGDDILEGGADADRLIGGDGVDDASYRMATSQVRLDLNAPQFSSGDADGDTFSGIERFQLTDRGDTFVASLGLDAVVFGHGGFDIFFANGGDDLFDGGDGSDFVRYDAAAGPVTIDLEIAEAQNTGGDGVDTLVSIEDVGGGASADTLRGTSGANRIFGQGGDDTLEGRGGDDVLHGNRGRDTLTGGEGNDEFFFFNFQNGDVVAGESYDGGAGTDRLTFENSADFSVATLTSIERLVFRGAAAATFAGNQIGGGALSSTLVVEGSSGSANALTVNLATPGSVDLSGFTFVAWGADDTITLNGSAGADSLRGSSRADTLNGGLGDDTYYVDSLGDVVVEARGEGNDRVVSSVSFNAQVRGVEVETIILTGAARTAIGDVFDNRLVGNAAQNILNGYKGADQMEGRGGDDIYVVDNEGDEVVETEGNGTDRVNSAIDYTLGANVENLSLLGGADISGTGNDGLNRIAGNRGDNMIAGSGGVDILSGGGGQDTFVYAAVSDSTYGGYDRILDLNNTDTIDLRLIDANENTADDNEDFVLVDSFSRTAGEMILDDSRDGLTFLVGDTDGDGRGDFRIALIGDHGDFDNFLGAG